MADARPNILFLMTDQQRFDTIQALGSPVIRTPNMDRLVARGVTFTNAYSACPVCVPARYSVRSGCEVTRTGTYANDDYPGVHEEIERRCGPYLPATLSGLGYRTFGVGKFHTLPWDAPVGFDVQLHSEELYETAEQRANDAYASWLAAEHPEYAWIEALMGERTEMYYMPQMSPLPADLTVEAWAADRTVELIEEQTPGRPWFGFTSFIGPHPPFAPPLPFNRMYDPDRMPSPIAGDLAVDHLDQQIPWMNHAVFAEEIGDAQARVLKARYYGEISYIDACVGRILDAVERRPDAANTLICFFSDHGEMLGDHHGWQKESFFEAAARVPFLVSLPGTLPGGHRDDRLVSLTDLFGIATTAAGKPELRQGADVLGDGPARTRLFGYHGTPGTREFKLMVREGPHKLIWMANGGRRLLFDVAADPDELRPVEDAAVADRMLTAAVERLRAEGVTGAFDGEELWTEEYAMRPLQRIYQFDRSRGVQGFPTDPGQILIDREAAAHE